MRDLEPRLPPLLGASPCKGCKVAALAELVTSLEGQPYCLEAAVYVGDAADPAYLWRYAAKRTWQGDDDGWVHVFIANDVERASAQALGGDRRWVQQMNAGADFTWSAVVFGAEPKAVAVLRILGNPRESFRDYGALAGGTPGS